jgi:hypothetical protein
MTTCCSQVKLIRTDCIPINSNLIYLITGGEDNDSEMMSRSRGTSPVESESGDTEVIYEVSDSEGNDTNEVAAESAEAQLST